MSLPTTYHRLESPTQTAEDARRQEESREIWGKPAHFSDIPKVKAYRGPLPPNQRGIEFTSEVAPDPDTPPHLAYWSGPRSGVRIEGEYAIIKVSSIINHQK